MTAPSTVWIGVNDLSRSGVPVALLRLMKWLSPELQPSVHVVAIRGGPLSRELGPIVGSLTVLEPTGRRSLAGAAATAARSIRPSSNASRVVGSAIEEISWKLRLGRLPRPDVMVVHGAGAWPLVAAVPDSTPVVLHLHELQTALDRSIETTGQAAAFARARFVMAVADSVADLAAARGADRSHVEVVPGLVDDPSGSAGSSRVVAQGRPSVMGVGSPGWRKGTDRLAPLALELTRRVPGVSVGWVGGSPSGRASTWVERPDPVRWSPECEDPWALFPEGAVLLIPSREDPLPLVALEAGQRRIPVVATPTGGLPSLLADGRGMVSGTHRIDDLCDLVELAVRDPALAAETGSRLAAHVARYHSPEVVGAHSWSVIQDAAR